MATAVAVSVPLTEYLETSYHPDCEWIEGQLRERNLGELSHASVQAFLTVFYPQQKAVWSSRISGVKLQVAAEQFRVPDVMVLREDDPAGDRPVAPLLCVQVLSRDDRMSDTQEEVDEYLDTGVDAVWVIDPRRGKAFQTDVRSLRPVQTLTVPGTRSQSRWRMSSKNSTS